MTVIRPTITTSRRERLKVVLKGFASGAFGLGLNARDGKNMRWIRVHADVNAR
jgi:hypothetical protein